ncbi:cell wall hydrolase [Sphingobium aromaticiconvertens]|uniref:cell wall hydrolase n=1 Tax=Sphingobium aromaticiconvertens TaxID=365341 RepID=UPI00301AA10A
MTVPATASTPHPLMCALWATLFLGIPGAVAWHEGGKTPSAALAHRAERAVRPPSPPPAVEPVKVYALAQDDARAFNAAIPISRLPNPAARPFLFAGSPEDLGRATDCLAAAQIYEAGDDAVGEEAVAQVVLNRTRHPAFPKTVCGVVFQGQERTTGCQFTFTCDGALAARTPSASAWARAREIATAALAGKVFKPIGLATHYHTNWVVPYWSSSLDKVAAVGTHLFFRWTGWWGTPPAFRQTVDSVEPLIARIARLSPAHQGTPGTTPFQLGLLHQVAPPLTGTEKAALLTTRFQQPVGTESLGKVFGSGRLIAMEPGARSFLFELGRGTSPDSWPALAETFCAGRSECRLMGWRASDGAPGRFPLNPAQIETMAFSYIHNADSGLQRALWNCALTPRADKRQCMRDRTPGASQAAVAQPAATPAAQIPQLSGVRRKERFETVTIMPPPKLLSSTE